MPSPVAAAWRDELRVIDAGEVSALRSQTLWHAVAYGVGAGAPATLVLLRPAEPYVCTGYHRRLDEIDLGACRRRGLPVYRRMVGGGPVYLDDGQLFFAIVVPATVVPPARSRALATLLAPAVAAFRAAGVDAHLDEAGEIVVDDRKVCGHGAGEIGGAVVVVGNLIERFDHDAAGEVLQAPSADTGAEVVRLMRRYVAPQPADPSVFRAAAADAYAAALGLTAHPGSLRPGEARRLAALDRRFCSRRWIDGPSRPRPPFWQVKVRAGVWVFATECDGTRVAGSVVGDRLAWLRVDDASLHGQAAALAHALTGCEVGRAPEVLETYGPPGERVAAALARCARRAP